MVDNCLSCESNEFVLNDDYFEVCTKCGLVNSHHLGDVSEPERCEEISSDLENQGIYNLLDHLMDNFCLLDNQFVASSTRDVFRELMRDKSKRKSIHSFTKKQLLKFALYVNIVDDGVRVTLPSFLWKVNMTHAEFTRIAIAYPEYEIKEKPSIHIDLIATSLELTWKETQFLQRVVRETYRFFQERRIYTYLGMVMYMYNELLKAEKKKSFSPEEISSVCGVDYNTIKRVSHVRSSDILRKQFAFERQQQHVASLRSMRSLARKM